MLAKFVFRAFPFKTGRGGLKGLFSAPPKKAKRTKVYSASLLN